MITQQYRSYILLPAALMPSATVLAATIPSIGTNPAVVPLVPASGAATVTPATYYGANGRLGPAAEQLEIGAALLGQLDNFPGVFWWNCTDNESIPGQKRYTVVQDSTGTPANDFKDGKYCGSVMTFTQAVAAAGLQPQITPLL